MIQNYTSQCNKDLVQCFYIQYNPDIEYIIIRDWTFQWYHIIYVTEIPLEDLLEEAQNYKLDADYIEDVNVIKLYDNKYYFQIPISGTVNYSIHSINLFIKSYGKWIYNDNNTFVNNFNHKLHLRVMYE